MGKKRGRGKKGKKGKKKEKKVKDMTEVTKELFEITVKDLTEKLEHCRTKCTKLQESNDDLTGRNTQLTADLGDVISFLKLQLEQKRDELAELTERLEGLDAQRTREQQECRETSEKLQSDMKKMQAELTSDVQMLTSKLNSLEEFRRMRERLFEERNELEHQLEQQKEEAEEMVYQADKQRIIDSDQLKRDSVRNITAVAQAFQQATRRRINQTTHRTIRENICLTSQMVLVAEKARHLDERNARLLERSAENDRVLGALEWTERSLVSATRKHEAELAALEERNSALAEIARERGQQTERDSDMACRLRRLETRLAEQQRLLEAAAAEQHEQALLAARLDGELHEQTEARERLEAVVAHAGVCCGSSKTWRSSDGPSNARPNLSRELLAQQRPAGL
ncbi:cilia- and flagella-associated protein 157-like [Pollicipes pollicipes]|uniref:cilia- and flagella-associated protein 157-like n=1 Tax=Pollicipes pollicipes TaxID=41117 RepID=UPI001884F393|nr:cilia- and flagella-associated protein 157-like [Pollicipes pollicipes]